MAYCRNCGTHLAEDAKFCQKCGQAVSTNVPNSAPHRQQVYEGKIYKCPNCGETLHSFVRNCPACGLELRGTKATSSVREFALKLEAIEARREYERPKGLFSSSANSEWISKTDEQKINLIQSFSIPNTKEDMLEFMILASSNWDSSLYGETDNRDKAKKALADAWLSKINQVYAKAKNSYGRDDDFQRIEEIYNKCTDTLSRQKKKKTIKWILLIGWIPLLLLFEIIAFPALDRSSNKKEEARLESILIEIDSALDAGDYKLALRNAESIEYGGHDKERARWWSIKKETLIDSIIDQAEEHGVFLQRAEEDISPDEEDDTAYSGGFVEGFKEGLQPGIDAARENIDEFNRILAGEPEEQNEGENSPNE